MRLFLQQLFVLVVIISIPFVMGANITDEFVIFPNSSETITESELIETVLSGNSTTNFDDFLDKEHGVYYELLDDVIEENETFENISNTFDEGENIIIIEDNLSDLDGVYISVDEFNSNDDDYETVSSELSSQLLAEITDGDVNIKFGEIVQSVLVDGANVQWEQEIILENGGSAVDMTLNLWSYDSILNRSFLWDIVKVSMSVDDEQISQTPIGLISLAQGEVARVVISYETPAVIVTKNCFDVTIADLLPSDATIIESTISLDVVVESICTGEITYPAGSRFKKVSFV